MDKTVSRGCLSGVVSPPCSKSYAQRALAVALLAEGQSVLSNMDFCNDTQSALNCIEMLGAKVERRDDHTIVVNGGLQPKSDTLCVGESGLSARLFTPLASLCHKHTYFQCGAKGFAHDNFPYQCHHRYYIDKY